MQKDESQNWKDFREKWVIALLDGAALISGLCCGIVASARIEEQGEFDVVSGLLGVVCIVLLGRFKEEL